jgi:hypothetical protein
MANFLNPVNVFDFQTVSDSHHHLGVLHTELVLALVIR